MKFFISVFLLLLTISATAQDNYIDGYTFIGHDSNRISTPPIATRGRYKTLHITGYNANDTLTDSVKFWHISEKNDTVPAMFRTFQFNGTEFVADTDTLKSLLKIPPKGKVDLVIWIPFPNQLMTDWVNKYFRSTKKLKLTYRWLSK